MMRFTKFLKLITLFVLFISWIPMLWVSIYSRPCADDFVFSTNTHKVIQNNFFDFVGLLQAAIHVVIDNYNNWQGTYTCSFLNSLQPGIIGEKLYFIGPWLLLISSCVLFLYSLNSLLSYFKLSNKNISFIGFFLFCYIVQSMPYPSEGLFWFCGAWSYSFFFFASLFNWALVYKACVTRKSRYVVISCIISIAISGGNYVTAFLNILLLFWFFLFVMFYYREHIFRLIYPLLFAIIGFAVSYFAPGTSIRAEALAQTWKPNVLITVTSSIIKAIEYAERWISADFFVVLLSFVIFLSFVPIKNIKIKLPSPFIFIVALIISFIGVICVPFYPLGNFGAPRVINIHWWTFCLFSIGMVAYFVVYLRNQKWFDTSILNKALAKKSYLYIIPLLTSIIFSLNKYSLFRTAGGELNSGIAQSYAQSFDDRIKKMYKRGNHGKVMFFCPLPKSGLLNISDLSTDLDDFRNQGWSTYYGMEAVVISNP